MAIWHAPRPYHKDARTVKAVVKKRSRTTDAWAGHSGKAPNGNAYATETQVCICRLQPSNYLTGMLPLDTGRKVGRYPESIQL